MQDFRKLRVWDDSLDLAIVVYQATEGLPASERFGLRSQMRSAAVSVSSNIAEGCGRPGRRDMARFLGIAIGSTCELQSQLILAERLQLLDAPVTDDLLARIDRLRKALISLHGRVKRERAAFPEDIGPAGDGTYHLPPTTQYP